MCMFIDFYNLFLCTLFISQPPWTDSSTTHWHWAIENNMACVQADLLNHSAKGRLYITRNIILFHSLRVTSKWSFYFHRQIHASPRTNTLKANKFIDSTNCLIIFLQRWSHLFPLSLFTFYWNNFFPLFSYFTTSCRPFKRVICFGRPSWDHFPVYCPSIIFLWIMRVQCFYSRDMFTYSNACACVYMCVRKYLSIYAFTYIVTYHIRI